MDFPLISATNLWAEHRESQRRGSFRRAFSLIELLVVVAIIALLTSLTLSCVVVIRGSAMGSACLSNQRQMYTGIFAYEIEEDGLLPPSAFHNWDRPYYPLMVAAHYLVTPGGQTNDIKNVLVCAAAKRTNSPPGNRSTITQKNAIWSSTPDGYSNGLIWINTSYCYVADAFSAGEYPDIAGHSIPRVMSSIKSTKALFF